MKEFRLLFLAILDEFKTLMFIRASLPKRQKHHDVSQEKPKPEQKQQKHTQNSSASSKDDKSIFHSGWTQNIVVALFLLFAGPIVGSFMKSQKSIVVCSAIGLTCLLWFLVFLILRPVPPLPKTELLDIKARSLGGIGYDPSFKVGGITWSDSETAVKLHFTTHEREVRNLNFKIMLEEGKTGIKAIGPMDPNLEMVASPLVQLTWDSPGEMTFTTVTTNAEGQPVKRAVEGTSVVSVSPFWRVRIPHLSPNTLTTLVIAGVKTANNSRAGVKTAEIEGTFEAISGGAITNLPFRTGLYVTHE